MAGRIRTIKPELLDDEVTGALSHEAFRAFVGAILLADDYGNLRAKASWFDGQVFWGAAGDASVALGELASSGLIEMYEVNSQTYAHINGWEKHQRVDKPGKPRVPDASESSGDSRETLANVPGSPALDLRPPTPDPDPDHRPTTDALARGASSPPDLGQARLLWREVCESEGMPKPSRSDPQGDYRLRHTLEALKSECSLDTAGLRMYFERIASSEFLRREKKPRTTLEWSLRHANAEKVLRGDFDERVTRSARAPPRKLTKVEQIAADAVAEMEQRDRNADAVDAEFETRGE